MVLYDLIVFAVDHAMSADEAAAEVGRLAESSQFSFRRDHRLDAFEARIDELWPGLQDAPETSRPFEFDVMRHHVFVGFPPASAEMGVAAVAEAAWSTGVAVFDPQRHLVGLPTPFADAPLGTDGIADAVRATAAATEEGAAASSTNDEGAGQDED
ncbi:MAG: hypothetical protein ABIR11_09415 [Candidatus Limnocylindrales bacterium]